MKRLSNKSDLDQLKIGCPFAVVHFYTDWCEPACQLNALLDEWSKSKKYEKVSFFAVDADVAQEAVKEMSVHAVPTIVFLRNGNFVYHIEGALIKKIEATIDRLFYAPDAEEPLEKRIENIIKREPIMVFLTGTPTNPECGFTSQICALLMKAKVEYGYFDIMGDAEILHGLKKYSSWPTYPQVYVNGMLVGGCDIVRDEAAKGKLGELLKIVS